MKNLTWQNPEQLFVAQVLINKVKSKCCGIKVLNQSNSLTDYGIKLKYPEVIYKDACVIADILSSYDPSEILSFTKPIGEQKKVIRREIFLEKDSQE